MRINTPTELETFRQDMLSKRDRNKPCITVCCGTACHAYKSDKIASAFEEEIKKHGLEVGIAVKRTGCHGFCEKGPIVVIYPEETCYVEVKPGDVPDIVSKTIKENEILSSHLRDSESRAGHLAGIKETRIIDHLLYTDPVTGEKLIYESTIPFYKNQMRIVFGPNKQIDPKKIDDYIYIGGYAALAKALSKMTPEQVIEEIKNAKLRGRGGGGFPTAKKWESTRKAPGEPKYVIVNCDEGDPGAYMDRSLMEGNPHSVIEGLIIGGYAIGASEGFIYVRQEYPLAVENTEIAIKQAEEYGLLGKDILGTEFNFKIKVHMGAGAFVSGESSALMTAIEGRVGEPRPKYIHTSESGLWEKPSTLNNVETWANVPLIISKGADWFSSIGTEESTGTKIFSLVGNVNNTGLVEVPMGTTLRDIIFEIGGGIPGGKKFKAVQTGGPSGGCIPKEYLDLPVDFDELNKLGSMMGSGGLIVMDEDTCMVDVARYFIEFLCDESCGKCVPCREGLKQMRMILTNICDGNGKEGDVELLETLANVTKNAALCALGSTSANPVLSTLRYFKDEYEAHINEKKCPALVCTNLISYYIDPKKCKACLICLKKCPVDAIEGAKKTIHVIDQSKCTKCGTCFDFCPDKFGAVKKITGEPVPPPIPKEERVFGGGKNE